MEDKEWEQLLALRAEMNTNLMAYDWYAQEKFTELLVKSLEGKGDPPVSRTGSSVITSFSSDALDLY